MNARRKKRRAWALQFLEHHFTKLDREPIVLRHCPRGIRPPSVGVNEKFLERKRRAREHEQLIPKRFVQNQTVFVGGECEEVRHVVYWINVVSFLQYNIGLKQSGLAADLSS